MTRPIRNFGVTRLTIDEALHYTDEERERIVAQYPIHERDARTRGIPMMGSGRVFPLPTSVVMVPHFDPPNWWPKGIGIDIGIEHPTAAVLCAVDPDTDTLYLLSEYRQSGLRTPEHAAAFKQRFKADMVPVAWPADALRRDPNSGRAVAEVYREHGLNLLPEAAALTVMNDRGEPMKTRSVEGGVAAMLDAMVTGQFKVSSMCTMWLEEFGLYHRKDGKIVDEREDLISASRYAFVMRDHFRASGRKPESTRYRPSAGQRTSAWSV